jgi:hypothetical protein
MEITDFMKFINQRTGAVFIVAYTNEDGQQTYGR